MQKGTKTNISYLLIRTGLFFGKFGVLCFFETRVLRFALLPYYRRNADIDFILIHNFDFF